MASGAVPIPAFGDGASFVKLSDGTLIQFGMYTFGEPDLTGVDHADQVISYPVTFNSATGTPKVIVSIVGGGTGAGSRERVCIPTAINVNSADTRYSSFTLRVWKQASVGTSYSPEPTVSWVAIGRWK